MAAPTAAAGYFSASEPSGSVGEGLDCKKYLLLRPAEGGSRCSRPRGTGVAASGTRLGPGPLLRAERGKLAKARVSCE